MQRNHHENVVSNLDIGVRFYESIVKNNGYVPFHWHSSIEIVCVMAGELIFSFNGQRHRISANQFMIISSGVIHDVTNAPNHAFVLQIPLDFIERYYSDPQNLNFVLDTSNQADYQKIVALFVQLNQSIHQQSPGYSFDCGIIVLSIIKNLILHFTNPNKLLTGNTSALKEIIVYINEHQTEPLTVTQLARQFGYNSSYLSRLFKQQTGITLIHYIYEVRLSGLYNDLMNTSDSIQTLFLKHGLTNERTSRTMFRQMYGQNPHEIRMKQ
jgi:AraC-like DNA-binding protein